ncbi:MAG: PASTA domain-containing protein [Clostridia bacterium]|nr:PASTA domain-containing protein [Clostridia bacterium]
MLNIISVKTKRRSLIVLITFMTICILILIALFKLQIINNNKYQNYVFDQITVETNVNPSRGIIYDRNGEILASNKTVWILYVVPKNIKDSEQIARGISAILSLDYEKVLEKVKKTGYKYQIIKKDLNINEAENIREFISQHGFEEQIQLNASSERYYPNNDLASHVLGFVNADGVGIYGLEKVYNNIMEGTTGKYITAQDAQSNDMPFQYETYIEDEDGYNLVTTLDMYIQNQLELQLETASIESGAQNRSAGIVMNPKTGEIYAMAVYPSFDLNEPYKLDETSLNYLLEYKNSDEYNQMYINMLYSMWNNKAVTELYEPGSTFKILTTATALQENAANLNTTFTCTGALKIDGYYRAISCHKRTGHGTLTFSEALQQSCNPYMMRLGFSIGKEMFYEYFQKFGYTSRTGIDLPSEAFSYYHNYDNFSNVSLAVYSFGQTFKTTAIQQLSAICTVANGGYSVVPHFIKEIVDNENNIIYEYENKQNNQILNEEVCKTISQILKEGVDGDGGAKNAYVSGYSVAAKTGTSEKKDKYDANGNTSYRVSSCVAYAPAEDPQIAVIMIVDEPTIGSKYGSVVVAPYIAKFLEQVLPYLGVEPSYSNIEKENEQIEVPDLKNKNVSNAIEILKSIGISYEIIGNEETVCDQMPQKGSVIHKKSGKVLIYTGGNTQTTVEVPNIIGLSAEQANLVLTNSGFNIKYEGTTNFKYGEKVEVVYQSIKAGEWVPRGTVITVKLLFIDEKE